VGNALRHSKEEDAIMSRIANLERQLKHQRGLLEAERIRRAGISVGDVVVSKGERFRVAEVKAFSYGQAWVTGNPEKKDGTFGTSRRNLYSDWQKEKPAA
jgi:hypothetical protein